MCGLDLIDVVYKSGKLATCPLSDAPKTVVKFIEKATAREQYDPIFKRTEFIFEMAKDAPQDTKTIYIVQEKANQNFVAEFATEEDAQVYINEWSKENGDDADPEDLEIVTQEVDADYELIEW